VATQPAAPTRGQSTRQAILDAAERVFAEVGFSTARLEDVAVAVGIRRASLIYYFPSKQMLYDEVEAGIFRALEAATDKRTAGVDDPWARIEALVDTWIDFMVARPTAARIITRLIADITPRTSNPVEYSDATLRVVDTIIKDGQRAGIFGPLRPMNFVNTIGASVLHYVCNANLYGPERNYEPADPRRLADYRALLHAIARTALALPKP